jgi:hypothetical protein
MKDKLLLKDVLQLTPRPGAEVEAKKMFLKLLCNEEKKIQVVLVLRQGYVPKNVAQIEHKIHI